ncbi:hypothetical protein OH77DRAFT_1424406 [Trametes cingulata]|nr:hypothetical protein OH77DRAFT_1424406 [Trametes cingulata]
MLTTVPPEELTEGPSEEFLTFLARSRSSPLTLDLRVFDSGMSSALMPRMQHLYSLSVRISTDEATSLYRVLSQGALRLEILSLRHRHIVATSEDPEDTTALGTIRLTREALPRLRCLRVPVALLCQGLVARRSTLECVAFSSCHNRYLRPCRGTHSFGDILPLIRECSALKKVRFLPGSYAGPLPPSLPVEPLHFPALQELVIDSDSSSFISDILRHLVLPSSTAFILRCGAIPDMHLQGAMQDHVIVSGARRVRLDFHDNLHYDVECLSCNSVRLSLEAPLGGSWRFITQGSGGGPHHPLATALGLFPSPSPSITSMHLSVDSSQTYAALSMQTGIVDVLDRFHGLVTLHFLSSSPGDLFRALAAPAPSDERIELRCPDLRKVKATWTISRRSTSTVEAFQDNCDLIRAVLGGRAGRGSILDSFTFTCVCTRRLRGRTTETAEEMKERLEVFFGPVARKVKVAIHAGALNSAA